LAEKKIDYLQYTASEIPEFLGAYSYLGSSPLPFYKQCYEFDCGARVFLGNANSDKYLVQQSGQSCERWDMTAYPNRLKAVIQEGGKFSRLDIAVTVSGIEHLNQFREAVRKNLVVSQRFGQDEPKIISNGTGEVETVYLGDLRKRAKKGVFRAYDKGKEQGLLEKYSRFELEIRGSAANVAAKRFLVGIDMGDLIRFVVDIPSQQWWADLLGEKSENLPRMLGEVKRDPIARRWHWLNKQVAPALGKLMAHDVKNDGANHQIFYEIVERHLAKALNLDTDE